VTACKRAIVIPDIADAPIDIREGCPLFPSVGNTADSRQGAVLHSCVGAATAIRSFWRRLGIGKLQEARGGDQERCKRADRDFHFHGRSFRGVDMTFNFFMNAAAQEFGAKHIFPVLFQTEARNLS
jgi:hypothetical protein